MAWQATRQRLSSMGANEGDQVEEDHAGARARLVEALQLAMAERGMTQVQAARLLGTDQPTLSKVLRGRTASVSLDKLVSWLLTLGRSVEIRVYQPAGDTRSSFTATCIGASDA
ncbi:MAG: helix-turn-helix domain-containing protein [Cypionkella sp.]